jgi:hypothetical protein
MNYTKWFVIGLFLIGLAGVVIVTISAITTGADQALTDAAGSDRSITPTATDIAELKAAVQQYYHVTGLAARTSDVSQFSTIMVNDPAVKLDEAQIAFLKRAGAIQQDLPADEGFLDFELANFGYRRVSAVQITRLTATPKVAPYNRNLTVGAIRPLNPQGLTPTPYRIDPMYEASISFKDFKIHGIRAEVTFDPGMAVYRMLLLKTSQGWKISDYITVFMHG